MSVAKKVWLITAAACVFLGLLIVFVNFMRIDFNFKELNRGTIEMRSEKISESFDRIRITGVDADVRILPAEDGDCRIDYSEGNGMECRISVSGGTLEVNRVDARKWYERFGVFFWEDSFITVYLPDKEYSELFAKTVSGDLELASGLAFGSAELISTSGEIECFAGVRNALSVKTVSGDMEVQNVSSASLDANTTSGEIHVQNIRAASFSLSSVSGDLSILNTVISGRISLKTTSGEIEFSDLDGEEIRIKSVSGDVEGSLLSGKNFVTTTTSGSVRVPASEASMPECEIKTTSGNIRITVSAPTSE